MRRVLALLALPTVGLSAAAAVAHAFLDHAIPAVGAQVSTAPSEVRLFFTQAIEPAFSDATLSQADGLPIVAGAAVVDPQNPMELVLKLPPLAPGRYKVRWHVVSVDTHRTEGSFGFDVE